MKIAMIGQKGLPAIYGGIEKHVEGLSKELVDLGHEVFVYTRPYYSIAGQKKFQGVNLISLPSIHTKHLDAISHTFLAFVHALFQDYDIIHYHGVGPSLLAWIPRLFKPSARVVATFHCIDRTHQKWGWFARLMLWLGEWSALHFPHQTIVISQTLNYYCRQNYNRTANYIPYATPKVELIKEDEDIKELFGLIKDGYYLSVSRLIKHKGLHYLVKAFRILNTDKKLVIVGDGSFTDDYVKGLKSLASGNPNIIFTGWQSGKILAELYSNAYAFVHPSESEGLPMSVLEAMAYGNGVLLSDIPEHLEAIDPVRNGISNGVDNRAGEYGFTFKNKEVNDLRKQMQFLNDNPALVKDAGQNAKEYVLESYNWRKVANETADLYQGTLDQKPVIGKLRTALRGVRFFHW